MYIYTYKSYICITSFQSASGDRVSELFAYIIYEGFHINLWECSMQGYCCVFSIQVYIIKFAYRVYTM